MAKSKGVPIQKASPIQRVVRIGEEITHQILRVCEYGTDDDGLYAIVEFGGPYPEGERMFVKSIDLAAEGDEVDRITFTPNEAMTDSAASNGIPKNEKPIDVGATQASIDAAIERVKNFKTKPSDPIMVKQTINVRLTPDERDEAAREASMMLSELASSEAHFKDIANAHKAKVKEIKSRIERCSEAYNTGLEFRDVTCEQRFDTERSRTWFLFRGQIYNERDMMPREIQEMQRSLFGDGPILTDKMRPEELPHPSELAGDQLASRIEREEIGSKAPGKRRPPIIKETIRPMANGLGDSIDG